jgi:hypothetical protein
MSSVRCIAPHYAKRVPWVQDPMPHKCRSCPACAAFPVEGESGGRLQQMYTKIHPTGKIVKKDELFLFF